MHQQLSRTLSEAERRSVLEFFRFRPSLGCVLVYARLVDPMQQPRLFERWVRADHLIKNEEQILHRRVDNFASEFLQLSWRICPAGITHGVVVLAGHMIHHAHRANIPQIPSTLEILTTTNRVPEAGGVHALASVVDRRK